MRSVLQGAAMMMLALGLGLTACQPSARALDTAQAPVPVGVPPLAQARLQMWEVADPAHGTDRGPTVRLNDRDGTALLLVEPALFTTADIAAVWLGRDEAGTTTLNIRATADAAPRLMKATEARVGRRIAVSVGDQVITAATIAGPFGLSMQIAGLEQPGEAERLYAQITGRAP